MQSRSPQSPLLPLLPVGEQTSTRVLPSAGSATPLRLRWVSQPEGLGPVLDGWRTLSATRSKPFSSPQWLLTWWAERPRSKWQLRVLIVEDDGGLAAILPMYAEDGSVRPRLRLLGQPGLWGYGPLIRAGAGQDVLAAIARELASQKPELVAFDALDPDDAAVVDGIARNWPAPGVAVEHPRRATTPTQRLNGTFDEWLAARRSSGRRYRRQGVRLSEDGGLIETAVSEADSMTAFDELVALHQLRWEGRSAWLSPHLERTFRRLLAGSVAAGEIRIWTVRIAGEAIAASMFVALGGAVISVLSGFDQRYQRYGPGMLARVAGIKDAFRRGDTVLDFGFGDQDYKSAMADEERATVWCELRPLSSASPPRLEVWEQGPPVGVPDLCVHELFALQVLRDPDAVAVIAGEAQISYAELEARANRLAHRLIALGAGPETIVGVSLERSAGLVVTLLAILKAGAAYLPLDPAWPAVRKRAMLSQAGARLLLVATPALAGEFAGDCVVVDPDADPAHTGAAAGVPPLSAPPDSTAHSAGQLAYVNFTSGSTGEPKGVLIEHRGILRLLGPECPWAMGPGDRLLQLAPVAFDASTLEVWVPLCSGATLVVGPAALPSLDGIAGLLAQYRITALWLTAGLFHAMAADHAGALGSVRMLITGGDVLHPNLVQAVLAQMPRTHLLINGYGPTEATTFTTCHVMPGGQAPVPAGSVPIGRPLSGTTVRVLDETGAPCPVDALGELHIGGSGLARGYLGDPALTEAKFIVDPHSRPDADRLYRSGDLVSWNHDGTLSFLARFDPVAAQLDLFIAAAVVAAALLAHPDVADAEVVLRRDDPSNPYLAAYWIPVHTAAHFLPTAAQLAEFLRETLPAALVPSSFVALEHFPLTANGKIDRGQLPRPSSCRPVSHSRELDELVHEEWAKVLGHNDFTVDDDFMLVGGNSLAAMRLFNGLERRLGRAVPVDFAVRFPTVRDQADWLLDSRPERVAVDHLVALQPVGELSPLYVLPGATIDLTHWFPLAHALGAHRPVMGLQPRDLDPGLGVDAIAAAYAADILRQQRGAPIHLAGFSAGAWWAFAVAGALLEQGAEIGMLAVLDAGVATPLPGALRRKWRATRAAEFALRLRRHPHDLRGRDILAAALRNRTLAARRAPAPEGPYLAMLRGHRFEPIPVSVDVFCVPDRLLERRVIWNHFVQGKATYHVMFARHMDFTRAEFAPQLAAALDPLMRRFDDPAREQPTSADHPVLQSLSTAQV